MTMTMINVLKASTGLYAAITLHTIRANRVIVLSLADRLSSGLGSSS
jgi:hypothetical protein